MKTSSRIIYYWLNFFLMAGMYSCIKDVTLNLDSNQIYVVNCILKNDSIQTLSLTKSVRISDNYIYKEVSEAKIILYLNDLEVGRFSKTGYDKWILHHLPVESARYRLEIETKDGVVISANTTMPGKVKLHARFTEDYFPSLHFTQESFHHPLWLMVLHSDDYIHPNGYPSDKNKLAEEIGTDHPLADRFNDNGSLVDFLPMANTPAFLFYVRINPKSESIDENIPFKLQTNYGNHSFVSFMTVSMEYDRYLKTSFQKVLMRLDVSDPLIWFDETRVFSNIDNGLGIFGAQNEHIFIYNHNAYFFEKY